MSDNKSVDAVNKANQITGFQLFAMTTSMVMTVYGFAAFAQQGPTALFFLFLASILWFVPVTRTSGEMASINGWSKGGVFTWTRHMLGEQAGWSALFYQWVHITVGMCTMMYFIIGCLSITFKTPALDTNPLIKFILMMIILWGLIAVQQKGTKTTGKIAQWCFTIGVIFPVFLLLFLFIVYLAKGNPMLIHITPKTIMPQKWSGNVLVGFVPFILAFAGAEGSAAHVKNLKNPKVYPKVMLALAVCAIFSDIIGTMSIASTIPHDDIQLSTGIVYAFGALLKAAGLSAGAVTMLERIIGLLLAIGLIGEIASWVVGPNAGMHEAAKEGYLPARFSKSNKFGIATNVMILQGVVVSIMAALLTFGAGGDKTNVSFKTAMSLTVALYTLMYMLMFIAYLVLTNKHEDIPRVAHAAKSKVLRNIIGVLGFVLSAFGFVVTFFPPADYTASQAHTYLTLLVVAFVIVFIIPFIMYRFHAKWARDVENNK
ncbi:APC family permease [Latilactobacillus curvatus]|uniref:Glutamate gamma-aminobutyrate antiporter n=1 Tax=Latilactobacillus curvatus TaxID=28038 RepID=A0A8F2IGX2_LATCU|nr:APC family permease [Latilactobacillus curvatus]ASN62677.1 glutamate:gamma-aminobutyrate antiporter [Latilactobacillus curvatus]MCT2881078.1 amino acid permease [Latilactobacillus curvatus]QWS69944.1 glutamate gamma-aminobutyrate antiporter [Latilactobacillus curvatus]WRS46385.1 APC family permease [Latilactobacillus curvatus]